MSAATEEWDPTEAEGARESGFQPSRRCLAAGDDLRAALLRLCDAEAPETRVWSIAPVPRKR